MSGNCIEVADLHAGTLSHADLRHQLRDLLAASRSAYPQIPSEPGGLEKLVDRVVAAVQGELVRKDPAADLTRRLQGLQLKGLGQANCLWPALFALASASAAGRQICIAQASRPEASEFLRDLWRGQFRPESLEWAIAAVLAFRPGSVREMHRCIETVAPSLLTPEAFEERYAENFLYSASSGNAACPVSPDWTLLWEYGGTTAFGGAWPADVENFVRRFLSEMKAAEPGAKILDIGTGNHSATMLAREVSADFDLYGIDVAQLPAPAEAARIHACRMNSEALCFADRSFAAVLSVNGIEYADLGLALPEMHRVMRPGARGALVLHRPDSPIVERSRKFMAFLEDTQVLETLALCWMYLHEGRDAVRRLLERKLPALKRVVVDAQFARYFGRVLQGIPAVIKGRARESAQAFDLIQRFETDLHWVHQRDRFLISHMQKIPVDKAALGALLRGYGFAVDAIEEVYLHAGRTTPPVGWAVSLHRLMAVFWLWIGSWPEVYPVIGSI